MTKANEKIVDVLIEGGIEYAELAPAIKKAFKAPGPTLIDVVTSTMEPFFKVAS